MPCSKPSDCEVTLKLQRLELQDVGRFGHLDQSLTGDLIGVVGKNGCGKSTILSSVHYAVTGDLSRLGNREAVALKRKHPQKQPFVKLTFTPENTADPASIVRWLPDGTKTGKRKLIYADKSWTIQDDIETQFMKWTGLASRAISDFVFVEQGALSDVLTTQPSKRAEILNRVLGIEAAESARKVISEHLAGLPAPPDTTVADALRARLCEAEAALIDASKALSFLPKVDHTGSGLDSNIVNQFYEQSKYDREVSRITTRIELVETDLAKPPLTPPDLTVLTEAEAVVKAWQDYAAAKATKAHLTAEATRLRKEADAIKVTPDPGPAPVEGVNLLALRDRKFGLEVLLQAEVGDSCPVCTHPLSVVLADRNTARATLDRLKDLENEFAEEKRKHARLFNQRLKEQTTVEANIAAAARWEAKAEAVVVPDKLPDTSEAVARAVIAEIAADQANYVRDAETRKANIKLLDDLSKELTRLVPSSNPRVTREEAEAAQSRLEAAGELEAKRRELVARVEALTESRDSVWLLLEKAQAQVDRSSGVAEWRKRVEAVRDLLHRDAAPADAAKAALEDLSIDLNNRLNHLAASFRVRVKDTGQLIADYHDGTTTTSVSTDRISWGEKVVLSLAWRIALLDRYAPNANVLCLDEPTHGLDRDRVAALRSALEAWKPHGAGRQFVIVTHDRTLLNVFDRVIEL